MPTSGKRRAPQGHRSTTAIRSLSDDVLPSQTRRDRRVQILVTAAAIASDGGYESVGMRSVAARAQVSLGTLYRYFPSKDHLLVAAFGLWLERINQESSVAQRSDAVPFSRLSDLVNCLSETATKHPRLTEAMATAYLSADSSAALDVKKIRAQIATMFAEAMGSTAPGNHCVQIGEILADVWTSNVLAVAHGRTTALELQRRMQITIDLVTRTIGKSGK
ncbi:TetR/AcrR family transcriptional regulator [Mycobacterium terramassiliense]|nr:TetR family transcriptional regulator [Mycobacterium terramassiliense]